MSADPLWAVTRGVTRCGYGDRYEYLYLRRSGPDAADWVVVETRGGAFGTDWERCGSEAVPADIRCPVVGR